jgi:hypothetical protein
LAWPFLNCPNRDGLARAAGQRGKRALDPIIPATTTVLSRVFAVEPRAKLRADQRLLTAADGRAYTWSKGLQPGNPPGDFNSGPSGLPRQRRAPAEFHLELLNVGFPTSNSIATASPRSPNGAPA